MDTSAGTLQRMFLNMENLVKEYREFANAELSELGLRPAEIVCLQTLLYHPEGLSVNELAGASERDKAQISRTLRVLEEKGYVVENPEDVHKQRKKRWQLSGTGHQVSMEMLEKNAPIWQEFEARLHA